MIMPQQQSPLDQIPLFSPPRPDTKGAVSANRLAWDLSLATDDETDPVCTCEFANHSREVDRQIRSRRR